jgi:hypothetical protein
LSSTGNSDHRRSSCDCSAWSVDDHGECDENGDDGRGVVCGFAWYDVVDGGKRIEHGW